MRQRIRVPYIYLFSFFLQKKQPMIPSAALIQCHNSYPPPPTGMYPRFVMDSSPQSCDSYTHLLHIPRPSFRLTCLRRFLLSGPPGIATSRLQDDRTLSKTRLYLITGKSIAFSYRYCNGISAKSIGYIFKKNVTIRRNRARAAGVCPKSLRIGLYFYFLQKCILYQ